MALDTKIRLDAVELNSDRLNVIVVMRICFISQCVHKKQRQQKQARKTICIYIYKNKHKQGCLTDNLLKAYCEC